MADTKISALTQGVPAASDLIPYVDMTGPTTKATLVSSLPAAVVKIAEVVTAGSQSTVDFSSIPSSYKHLWVVWQAADTQAGTNSTQLSLKINADATSGDYTAAHRYGSQNGSIFASDQASTSAGGQVGFLPQAGNTSFAGSGELRISNYATTTFHKRVTGNAAGEDASNNGTEWTYNFRWKSTAAINELTFTPGGTAFQDGSIFTLYGMQ